MGTKEKLVLGLFMLALATTYVAAGSIVLRRLWQVIRRVPAPRRPAWRRWGRRAVLAAAVLGLACMAYGYFVEPYWLAVTHVRLHTAKIPPGSRPIRIVHFSDLHCDPKPRLEFRLLRAVADLKPDLIAFTGDAMNSSAGLERFRMCLRSLSEIAPTFCVRGNWDSRARDWSAIFAGTGAELLENRGVTVRPAGVPIRIAGSPTDGDDVWGALTSAGPAGPFTVFLYHFPDSIENFCWLDAIDLHLAGHTHGGQVCLPLYGALVTLSKFGKRYEAGLYRVRNTWLYVNRGIGMEGGHMPRVRFLARPEVTLIELCPEDVTP